MEKEKMKKRSNAADILDTEGNKIRKVSNSVNSSKQGNEKLRPNDVMKSAEKRSSLDVLLEGMTNVELGEDLETLITRSRLRRRNEEFVESASTSRDSFSPIGKVTIAPKPPVAMDDAIESDADASDAESEFCPAWSSSPGSSSTSLDDIEDDMGSDVIYDREGAYFLPESEIDFTMENSDDDGSLQFADIQEYEDIKRILSKKSAFSDVTNLPIPAAGNEKERTMSSQTTSSDGRNSPVAKFKPQAIRRVKSMIYEVAMDNEIDAGQRSKVLLRKHARDVTPSQISMSPSPLLSAEDAGSLKRSPSQVSCCKFSLKRSRSNLTVAENYIKRHPIFEGDVIHEESDDDVSSDAGIEMKIETDGEVTSRNSDV
ncbi:uncharacterized protein LOC120348232 [Styela clava]